MITTKQVLTGFSFRNPLTKKMQSQLKDIKAYRYTGTAEKIIYQNRAEVVDIIEGVLLDSYLLETKRGYMILKDTYLNPNQSIYTIYYSTDSDKIQEVWDTLKKYY